VPDVDAEVAIVGAGPVGMTLAILLAQLDLSVIVLERWPEPYPLPRAVHLDHEVARIFQSCGLGTQLRDITEPGYVYEWRNAADTTLLRFGRHGDSDSGWPESLMFNQPTLEAMLERRASELPALTVRRDAEVIAVDAASNRVTIRIATGGEVRARYVVGCDGANSMVRAAAELPVHDLGFDVDWLIVDVILNEARVFDPINVQICDPARPTTAVSGGPGRRRWEFMRLPHESREDLDDEGRAWELLASWGIHPGNARLERQAVYTFNARYAENWRRDRILIAGDAAHLMPPFAGQGMCSGVRDAANLAWKLHHVLIGIAADSLLDAYQEERVPSVNQSIEFSVELGKVICVADPAEAAARDELMAAGVTEELVEAPSLPGLSTGLVHLDSPHAGELFVQGYVGGQRFDDVHGVGWRLLTVDELPVDATEAEWFTSIGGSIVPVVDADPAYRSWFDSHACSWALQRPDFYLYGTADCATAATALLAALRHDLRAGRTLERSTR
jgi:2-polyprenyl-6-methoxyphenol hydroxylase-like FAD-dependent oxidoreductase